MKKPVVYVAGPMTGLKDFNYPAFEHVAQKLRLSGFDVLNPADNPIPACGSWVGYMRMSLQQVAQADLMLMLSGWKLSDGAVKEHQVAGWLRMPVLLSWEPLGPQILRLPPELQPSIPDHLLRKTRRSSDGLGRCPYCANHYVVTPTGPDCLENHTELQGWDAACVAAVLRTSGEKK